MLSRALACVPAAVCYWPTAGQAGPGNPLADHGLASLPHPQREAVRLAWSG